MMAIVVALAPMKATEAGACPAERVFWCPFSVSSACLPASDSKSDCSSASAAAAGAIVIGYWLPSSRDQTPAARLCTLYALFANHSNWRLHCLSLLTPQGVIVLDNQP